MPEKCCKKAKMPSDKMFANEIKNKAAKKFKTILVYTVNKKKLQQTLQNANAINLLSIFKICFSQYYCNLLYAWLLLICKKRKHFCKTLPLIKHWPIKVSDWVIMGYNVAVSLILQWCWTWFLFFPRRYINLHNLNGYVTVFISKPAFLGFLELFQFFKCSLWYYMIFLGL